MRFLRTAILAIGVMGLGLAACGGSDKGESTTPAANPCAGGEAANPCAAGGEEANPCAGGEEANPCAGGEENPCAGGEENPCGGEW